MLREVREKWFQSDLEYGMQLPLDGETSMLQKMTRIQLIQFFPLLLLQVGSCSEAPNWNMEHLLDIKLGFGKRKRKEMKGG